MAGVAGRSGRKLKPTGQKMLAGNPGKRKLNTNEPSFTKVTHVDPPDWLSEKASIMWVLVSKELIEDEVLAVTDLHNVEAFCMAYSRWRDAEDHINIYGAVLVDRNERSYKNPSVTVANEAMRQMNTFGGSLGLDPDSRNRLIGGSKQGAGNQFAEF